MKIECFVQFYFLLLISFSELNGTVSSGIDESNSKLTEVPSSTSQSKEAIYELIMLSLPAFAGQAIEPLVQLMETAFIGRLGKVDALLFIWRFICELVLRCLFSFNVTAILTVKNFFRSLYTIIYYR